MAISPPGDIVLDVARAASPSAVAQARARLESRAQGLRTAAAFDIGTSAASSSFAARPAGRKDAVPEAYVKFEGMVLQTFLQSMLPEDAGGVYGQGMSGEMWKSLLARTLGEAMAERGGIGIASRLIDAHYVENGEKVPVRGIGDKAEEARMGAQDLLSAALVHEIQRRTTHALGEPSGHAAISGSQRDV